MSQVRVGFRFRDEFEVKCQLCEEYWPTTLEFWSPGHGLVRCRACWRLYKRLDAAERRKDPLKRAALQERNRLKWRTQPFAKRLEALEKARQWKAEHPERVEEYRQRARDRRAAAREAA